ncbi:MAG: hypothetical protein J6U90_04955 [Methanobrevibacter sp.]|nr:hypothetical protein [Methanobrevibacter sp.]
MSYKMMSMDSIAKQLNNMTYTDYYNRLSLLARVRYEWENLPNNIDERWIEKYLYFYGHCLFFDDRTLGYMVAKSNLSGSLNNYDEHTHLTPCGTNYKGKSLRVGKECVLIRNNDDMIPTMQTIQLYAFKLANISRTADVNIHAQKTPSIILCSEKQRLTMKTVLSKVNDFEYAIYGDKNLDIEGISTLDLNAPIVFDKLELQKHAIWNECMTFLGINNANQDKRERLVDDEVQANNEQVEYNAQIGLKTRQKACEQINALYGTNIKVRMRKLNTPLLLEPQPQQKEGALNE